MKIIPVKKYVIPDFPTHDILDEHPELLRLVPERWQRNPIVLSALAGLCLLVLSSKELSAAPSKAAPRIAPIFQHGEGSGSFGCMAVNSPVFLSEAEACRVIIDEGKRAGITFVSKVQTLRSVSVPVTDRYAMFGPSQHKSNGGIKTSQSSLQLDGTDRKRNISFEYVSESDFNKWEKHGEFASSAYTYELLNTAKSLREGLKKAEPSGTYAVFYDPMSILPDNWYVGPDTDWEKRYAKAEAQATKTSRDELRKQVKDFIVWMKAQGVI
ncbi:MAG: hypothetical protein ACYC27_06690 [Armatimonadota bacterium]